jgi:long-chain fatty acid transport protein
MTCGSAGSSTLAVPAPTVAYDGGGVGKFSGLTPVLQALLQNRGLLNADLDLKVKVPQTAMGSFFHQLDERWAILGSVGWQDWSQFGQVEIGIDSINPTSATVDLPFNDTWHGALGAQYRLSPTWLLNFGVAYDDSFQDENDVSPLVPAGETWRFAIGAQYAPRKDLDIGLGFVYAYTGNLDVNKQSLVRGDLVGSYNDVASVIFSASANWRF